MSDELAARMDRLESVHDIEQLAIRYALAVDGRDLDAWLALFPDDVDCGRHGSGRDVLRSLIAPQLRRFYRSIHQLCGHRIEFEGPDRAGGIVYCRAEHEVGDRWMVMVRRPASLPAGAREPPGLSHRRNRCGAIAARSL